MTSQNGGSEYNTQQQGMPVALAPQIVRQVSEVRLQPTNIDTFVDGATLDTDRTTCEHIGNGKRTHSGNVHFSMNAIFFM